MEEQFNNPSPDPASSATTGKNYFRFLNFSWQGNIVSNSQAPELYSRTALFFFTILCSVFFSGVMMYMNMSRLKSSRGKMATILFVTGYVVIVLALYLTIEKTRMFSFFFTIVAALLLVNPFWGSFIGKTTEYRTRSVKSAVIIAVSLFVLSTAIVSFYISAKLF